MQAHARFLAYAIVLAAAISVGWAAQPKSGVTLVDEDACRWCLDDPEIQARLGVVAHEPIAIGPASFGGSEAFRTEMSSSDWVFIETTNLRWALSLRSQPLKRADQKRLEPYFQRMREAGIELPKKVKKLDPELAVHLYAMRGEDLFERFLEIIQHEPEDFPDKRQDSGPYMGNGRYLGEADKFEVYIHQTRFTHEQFTKKHMGTTVTGSLRWHFQDPHKMVASCPAEDSDLRADQWLWPYVAHNLSHLFLGAYKHFSFQPPVWLDEGLALALEREAEPTSITTEGEEGTLNENLGNDDWVKQQRKLLRSDEPRMAQLLNKNTLGSLTELDIVSCWSRVRFLLDEHPDNLAELLGRVKGQLDSEGYPTRKDMDGLQRRTFKELWGWSFADFDEQWKEWLALQF